MSPPKFRVNVLNWMEAGAASCGSEHQLVCEADILCSVQSSSFQCKPGEVCWVMEREEKDY